MSRRLSESDWRFTIRLWSDGYLAIGIRDMEIWRKDWVASMESIKYVQGLKSQCQEEWDQMLALRAQASVSVGNLEAVMADLETVWDDLSSGLKAVHAFRQSADGLEMRFAFLTGSEAYGTGSISLVLRP